MMYFIEKTTLDCRKIAEDGSFTGFRMLGCFGSLKETLDVFYDMEQLLSKSNLSNWNNVQKGDYLRFEINEICKTNIEGKELTRIFTLCDKTYFYRGIIYGCPLPDGHMPTNK